MLCFTVAAKAQSHLSVLQPKHDQITNVVDDMQMSESNTVYPPYTSVFQEAQAQCFSVSFLNETCFSMMLSAVATPDLRGCWGEVLFYLDTPTM